VSIIFQRPDICAVKSEIYLVNCRFADDAVLWILLKRRNSWDITAFSQRDSRIYRKIQVHRSSNQRHLWKDSYCVTWLTCFSKNSPAYFSFLEVAVSAKRYSVIQRRQIRNYMEEHGNLSYLVTSLNASIVEYEELYLWPLECCVVTNDYDILSLSCRWPWSLSK